MPGQGGMDDGAVILYFLHHAAQPHHPLCPVLELSVAFAKGGAAGDGRQRTVQTAALPLACITSGVEIRSMEIVFSALNFLLYWYFLRLDFFKLLFTYLLIVDYLLVIRGIAAFLAVRCLSGFAPGMGWAACFVQPALPARPFRRCSEAFAGCPGRSTTPVRRTSWQTIWLVPAILSALTILSTNAWAEQSAGSWLFLCLQGRTAGLRTGHLLCAASGNRQPAKANYPGTAAGL